MGRFSLLSLMILTALSLSLSACDDKKQEEQTQQSQEAPKRGGPPRLPLDEMKKKTEEEKKTISQEPIELKLGDATAFATAEGATAGAVFLRISNPSPREDFLNGVTATVGTSAELHKTTIDENGTATMRKVRQLTIKPGNHLVLNPKGHHIMILGLTKALKVGDIFEVTLDFNSAQDVTVPVKVIAPYADAHAHHPVQKMVTPPDALKETVKKLQAPQQPSAPAAIEHQHEHPAQ